MTDFMTEDEFGEKVRRMPISKDGQEIAGRELPLPGKPMDVARVINDAFERPISCWRKDFYEHRDTHWAGIDESTVRNLIYRITEKSYSMVPGKEKGTMDKVAWAPTTKKVNYVLDALKTGVLHRDAGQGEERVMAFTNGVLPSIIHRKVEPHTHKRFNLTCRPFAYDHRAQCHEWLMFIETVLPDPDAQRTMQEWMGYVLSERTDLHKIGVLIGPPRSGKGTINRILRAMVGEENFAAPTLARFDGQFALAGLIGKSLATFGDIRWSNKSMPGAVETMLTISGGDPISIPRKNKDDWEGILGTRFMLLSNDAPGGFLDASGALVSRMVFMEFRESFYGREDHGLQERLMKELSGIFNWALEGAQRLAMNNGKFTQSADAIELSKEARHSSSPVMQWADEWCDQGNYNQEIDVLFQSYRDWLEKEGSSMKPAKNRFSRDLASALPAVRTVRSTVGRRATMVHGLRVRPGAQNGVGPGQDNVINFPTQTHELFDDAR